MGHADIRTTLNIYAKAVPGWQEQAAAKLEAYLDGETGLLARTGFARQSRDSRGPKPSGRERVSSGRDPPARAKKGSTPRRGADFESP